MIGSSYEGFTVVMALLNPHPALKVAAPESPMVDGWMGDDWFHYGAFRQPNIDYVLGQTSLRGEGVSVPHQGRDDYTNYLRAGSADAFAKAEGMDQLPYWHVIVDHPAYDGFWQSQALDKLIVKRLLTVPTMWEQGLWDQEDMWGAIHSYRALKATGTPANMNYLVMGPWFHSQVNREGRALGPLVWATDTAAQWRREVLLPFFNQYLKPGALIAPTPAVFIYDIGIDRWDRPAVFPASCEKGCPTESKPLYLEADGQLSFEAPPSAGAKFDEYISDPAKPVPYRPRRRSSGRYGLAHLAGHRPEICGRTPRCTHLRDGAPEGTDEAVGRSNGSPHRINQRDGLRLGRQADRCAAGSRGAAGGDERVRTADRDRHLSRPLPHEFRAS
jgi:hypothetical protein